MTWTKLGDEFADECWTLSPSAFRLHVEGHIWANRKLTDGSLAKGDMHRWAHDQDAAEELVSIGWWEDRGEHYQIIHHIGYQRTREQVARQSIANTKNRAKGVTRPVQRKEDSSDKLSDGSSDGSSDEMDRTGQDSLEEKNVKVMRAKTPLAQTKPSLGRRASNGADDPWAQSDLEQKTRRIIEAGYDR